MSKQTPIPITVFTGFLGAGKTSVILSLLPQLPKDYKVVLLKNEFGDVEVDSKLAGQSSLTAVSEILNGCVCCVLVGQMQTALLEIREKYRPDRIIIECSGSAFPATLAFQIRELERETGGDLKLDAIVTVVDAENFAGYEDTSPTARMQASYTDIILINKWEHVSERALDFVVDHLNTLNELTPKILCRGRSGVDPGLIFGLESKLFLDGNGAAGAGAGVHNEEVETVTVYRGRGRLSGHEHGAGHGAGECDCGPSETAHAHEHVHTADVVEDSEGLDRDVLDAALNALSKESVWRVKGFVKLKGAGAGVQILNWAFGRFELTPLLEAREEGEGEGEGEVVRVTVMGERGEVRRAIRKFCGALGAEVV